MITINLGGLPRRDASFEKAKKDRQRLMEKIKRREAQAEGSGSAGATVYAPGYGVGQATEGAAA